MSNIKESLLKGIMKDIVEFDNCIKGMDESKNSMDINIEEDYIYIYFSYVYTDDRNDTFKLCNNEVNKLKESLGKTLNINEENIYVGFNRKDANPDGTSLYSCTIEMDELKSISEYIE